MRNRNQLHDQTFAGVFLIGLAILFITGFWWPGIMFVIGIAMIARAVNEGRPWNDDRNALIVLGFGVAFTLLDLFNNFNLNTGPLWPIILIALGVYLLYGKNLRPGGGSSNGGKSKNDELL